MLGYVHHVPNIFGHGQHSPTAHRTQPDKNSLHFYPPPNIYVHPFSTPLQFLNNNVDIQISPKLLLEFDMKISIWGRGTSSIRITTITLLFGPSSEHERHFQSSIMLALFVGHIEFGGLSTQMSVPKCQICVQRSQKTSQMNCLTN